MGEEERGVCVYVRWVGGGKVIMWLHVSDITIYKKL